MKHVQVPETELPVDGHLRQLLCLKIRNMFGFWVSAELALSAHPALHLHGKPVQSGPWREEGFTDACWLPFQLACSDLNKAVQELMS